MLIKITIEIPDAMLEIKKNTGKKGEYQRG